MTTDGGAAADVVLVGFEGQENLGLRSIMSWLLAQGHKVELVPFAPDHRTLVVQVVRSLQPRLVGFSLIFQGSLDEFGGLMADLRAQGVNAHFTAGGHFPSLRPEATFQLLPHLQSIVRFEGELTLCELVERLEEPARWEQIAGLAFRRGTEIVRTPLRPLIADLDTLPPVWRDEPRVIPSGIKTAAMLASRGCLFNCSFCSIRQFYGSSSGPLRRTRSPQAVAAEMLALYVEKGVRLFSFQDDDFAARTPAQRRWLNAFLQELRRTGLVGATRWKVSCRVDDLEPELLAAMRSHGLIAVYLGVESGSPTGLRTLGKHVTVDQNRAAVDLLKETGVALSIGFMLFDPSTTETSIRENLAFLRYVGEDGYFPINFCKMLPYAGTPIEAQLQREGRLRGTVTEPDYGFLDPRLDGYELLVKTIFTRRNFGSQGLMAVLPEADFDDRVARDLGYPETSPGHSEHLREITRRTNLLAVETLAGLLDELMARELDALLEEQTTLLELAEREWRGEMLAEVALTGLRMGVCVGTHWPRPLDDGSNGVNAPFPALP